MTGTNEDMLIIAGLGNPGLQYAQTRHNIGFRVLDLLTMEMKATMPKEKFNGLIFQAKVKNKKILLVKPQTFMNNSGECLAEIMRFYKLKPENFLVIYDDIDLPEGSIRVRAKGGAGTHNGMRSIVSCLGSENFMRIRVGMGQPEHKEMDLADFVLGKIKKESEEKMNRAVKNASEAAIEAAENGIEAAMQKYNTMG